MKQFIVMTASLLLGLALFSLIVSGDDSIYSSAGKAWEKESELRVLSEEPAGQIP